MQRPSHDPAPILSAREALTRHRARQGPGPGALYLRQLQRTEMDWLRAVTRRTAADYHVDADDLLQELILDLWSCDTLDQGRTGFRSWMAQRARWRAVDMLRNPHLQHSVAADPEDMAELGECAERVSGRPQDDWPVGRLRDLGLTGNEARLIVLILWGLDVPLQEVAAQIGRTYGSTRQDRSRGLRRIRQLFDLEPEEEAAFVAVREYRGIEAAAVRLEIDVEAMRRRFRAAEHKINLVLGAGSEDHGRDETPVGADSRGDV